MQTTYDVDKRKLLSALCHGAIFFSPFVITAGLPLGILLVSDDPIVKESARESLNFHFNIWIYTLIAGFLWFTIILIPFSFLLGGLILVATWVLPILAILKSFTTPDQSFRYPFIFRVL